jgi:hypothetical protein
MSTYEWIQLFNHITYHLPETRTDHAGERAETEAMLSFVFSFLIPISVFSFCLSFLS